MTIPSQRSLHGFIATAPQLNFMSNGTARFHARIGVEHYRKETDGSFTKLDSTFHDLIAYAKTAERAYGRFRVGDNLLASGYVHDYQIERDGHAEAREEFIARRLGHDLARTRYEVDRSPIRQPDPPAADLPDPHPPAPADRQQAPVVGV